MSRKPSEFLDWPESITVEFGPFRGVVRHWVDGDTVDVLIDFGFNSYGYHPVRLLGVDTPELNRAASKEAGLRARDFAASVAPVGSKVRLWTLPDPDSFGRYLAAIETADGVNVGEALVEAGHAVRR